MRNLFKKFALWLLPEDLADLNKKHGYQGKDMRLSEVLFWIEVEDAEIRNQMGVSQ